MAKPRPTSARSLYPRHPSSADDLASPRTVQGQIGSGASRIWNNLVSETRKEPEPQPSFLSQLLPPKSYPMAMKKKGK
jgi:hypothetical protein